MRKVEKVRQVSLPVRAALLGALFAGATFAQLPGPQETPAEYRQAVEEAAEIGGYLFTRYHYEREGRRLLEAEGIADSRILGSVLGADAGDLLVRFIGFHDGGMKVLYEVRFDKQDRSELIRVDPPRKPTLDDALAFFAKRAAMEALPMRCADRYAAVISRSHGRDAPRDVYLVPIASKEGEIAVGGFARVTVGDDGQTVLKAEALSKSCLTMSKPDEAAGAPFLMTTHLVSSTPLATHVFLSMVHERPIVVVTDAGSWGVAAREILFLGPPPDEDCCDEALADAGVPRPPVGFPESWEHAGESADEPAPWRERLIVWKPSDDPGAPWQEDERFRGQFPTDYPSDLPVVFPPDEGDNRFEMMWVRVFAYDASSDRYLGHLLNAPRFLHSVAQGDRVVFGYDEELEKGLARHDGGDYEVLTLPSAARGGRLAELYMGIRHYRRGEYGNVPEEIQACIETLTGVVRDQAPSFDAHHRFLAHYFLGRCLAESYETDRAIVQFEKALDLKPNALDPNLALLAELCIKVHKDKESRVLEARYLDQLELVRERYGDHPRVAQVLGMMFDPQYAGDLSGLRPAEIARRERVGFGAFRWKMP